MVERLLCTQDVAGSNPVASTSYFSGIARKKRRVVFADGEMAESITTLNAPRSNAIVTRGLITNAGLGLLVALAGIIIPIAWTLRANLFRIAWR